jgi:pimeloyl-ACP methyl ester carboxylesterase
LGGFLFLEDKLVETSVGKIHVVEAGDNLERPVLFLHGWPENSYAWRKVIELTQDQVHALAIDLPGIGSSKIAKPPCSKTGIAGVVNELVDSLGLEPLTLVGHDAGGQVVFAYLTRYAQKVESAVIMDVAVPGLKPWMEVLSNPYIWHFKFHTVPDLPEILVSGKERQYFDYFFNAISAEPESISSHAREEYVKAYSTSQALSTGFGWYRAFDEDAKENKAFVDSKTVIDTPLLYLRGDHEEEITEYVEGFKEAGFTNVESAVIGDSGHFTPEEQPEKTWQLINEFINKQTIVTI